MSRKIVFFHAAWCGPCKALDKGWLMPIEQECRDPAACIERIDAWQNPGTADQYGISLKHIPLAAAVQDGKLVTVFSGVYPSTESVIDWLEGRADDFS